MRQVLALQHALSIFFYVRVFVNLGVCVKVCGKDNSGNRLWQSFRLALFFVPSMLNRKTKIASNILYQYFRAFASLKLMNTLQALVCVCDLCPPYLSSVYGVHFILIRHRWESPTWWFYPPPLYSQLSLDYTCCHMSPLPNSSVLQLTNPPDPGSNPHATICTPNLWTTGYLNGSVPDTNEQSACWHPSCSEAIGAAVIWTEGNGAPQLAVLEG